MRGNYRARGPVSGPGWLAVAVVLMVGSGTAHALDAPAVSVPRGFYTDPFSVSLSSVPGATIHFTTDASTPSPTVGTEYRQPIRISTTTPLRAVAFLGAEVSPVVTHTYLFLADVLRQDNSPPGYPSTFAAMDEFGPYPADYEMDRQVVGSAVYADRMLPALQSIPSVSLVTDVPGLFDPAVGIYYNSSEKGPDWERVASLEWLDPHGGDGFAIPAGVRMHGQSSRRPQRTPKHSFRTYFRATLGDGKLNFPVFAGGSWDLARQDVEQGFDRLILKAGSNHSWPYYSSEQRAVTDYVNDEFARVAFREMGHLAPHGARFVHLYLNGLYWGLYDVVEHVDDHYLTAYLGGLSTDYDLITPDEDAEPRYAPTADLGTMDAWNELHALVDRAPVSDATYAQVLTRLDVVDLVDYIIVTHYVANGDWPAHNWFAYRNRVGPDFRFKCIPWDNDASLASTNRNITREDADGSPARLFLRLASNPQFRQLISDRLALHTSGTGALTPGACHRRYKALTDLVDLAVIGESARWGDYSRDVYQWLLGMDPPIPAYLYTRDEHWVGVRDAKFNDYCPNRTTVLVSQYIGNGWHVPGLLGPVFSPEGGVVAAGSTLVVTNPNGANTGEILVTRDGTDPRLPDGSVAPGVTAQRGEVRVGLDRVLTVTARIKDGNAWSPPSRATFHVPQDFSALVINEVHYKPAGMGSGNQEFVELHNRGALPLGLDQVSFSRGIIYTFPENTVLGAGEYLVLADSLAGFTQRYGFAPNGEFGGALSGNGEPLELITPEGEVIDRVDYGVIAPWPPLAAGMGPSLELRDPALDNADPASWQASWIPGGTPKAPNSTQPAPPSNAAAPGAPKMPGVEEAKVPQSSSAPMSSSAALSSSSSAQSSSSSALSSSSAAESSSSSVTAVSSGPVDPGGEDPGVKRGASCGCGSGSPDALAWLAVVAFLGWRRRGRLVAPGA